MVLLKDKGNTKVYHKDGYTIVKLYNTEIVRFNSNIIVLNTGGWYTVTTKQRMNQAADEYGLGYRVFQHKHQWYVRYNCQDTPFCIHDQVTIKR